MKQYSFLIESKNHEDFYKITINDDIVKKCNNPIGEIGLSFYEDIKSLGFGSFVIYEKYRHQGHGKRTILNLVKKYKNKYDLIYCFVDKDNIPAINLYKKIGKIDKHPNKNNQYMVTFWSRKK